MYSLHSPAEPCAYVELQQCADVLRLTWCVAGINAAIVGIMQNDRSWFPSSSGTGHDRFPHDDFTLLIQIDLQLSTRKSLFSILPSGLISPLRTQLLAARLGTLLAKVPIKFTAKRVTAVNSVTADAGSQTQARADIFWYASTCAATRSAHPVVSRAKPQNINRLLKRSFIPLKAGSTRCPMQNTISAKKPTVRAWRDAPQIPGAIVVMDAQIPSRDAITAHT